MIGEDSIERQQNKMSEQFLLYATFRVGMEFVDGDQVFGGLIQFLNTPT